MAQNFEDLKIWQEAHLLALEIYQISQRFPKEEVYNLTSQIRRAALSVPTNIAEAHGRMHYLETVKFIYNARGSIEEVRSLLYFAKDLNYISDTKRDEMNQKYIILTKRINSFVKAIKLKKETG